MPTEIKPAHSHPHGCRKTHQFLPVIFTPVHCLITIISQIHTVHKGASKSDPLLLQVTGSSTIMKLNDPSSEQGTMSRSSLQIHREDYMCSVVLIKLKIITVVQLFKQRPLAASSWVVSRDDFLYVPYLLLDGHCTMPTEHNGKTYTPEERATKHTLKLEAFGVCLTPLKRLLNMSQLLCSGLQQQL